MVTITAQSLRCIANTQEGTQCKFRGIHMAANGRYCGNHFAQLGNPKASPAQASLPFSPSKEVIKAFGPTKDSVQFAETLIGIANSDTKEPSTAIAYMLDGYIANLVRQQTKA